MNCSVTPMRLIHVVIVITLAFGALSAAVPANAQNRESMRRLGILWVSKQHNWLTQGVLNDLEELGWIDGKNIIIEQRFTGGKFEQVPTLIQELLDRQVEVIFAGSTPLVKALQKATTTIPIIFCCVSGPIKEGFIKSFAQPGGNITGVSSTSSTGLGVNTKRLALLKEAVPTIRRVGLLINPAGHRISSRLQKLEVAGRSLDIQFEQVEVKAAEELEQAFTDMRTRDVDAFFVLPDRMFFAHRKRIVELAAQHHLPTIYNATLISERTGGLMAYGQNWPSHLRHAMTYVDMVLRGAKPANLPVERPRYLEFVINLKTAKTLGLSTPPMIIYQADKVIR